ncbi:hypothetical protein JVT61DRAFT_13644 [Boletus reticuloceps]|uniref:Uncharacterized protein n=1 Tax=Boletus reticuloceps TaxID=495285 RepID=A0A8I2YDA2_9AGAM|nr:hypothetical protein JVT61DRAFT_13644 [Boletus reticuloceps]
MDDTNTLKKGQPHNPLQSSLMEVDGPREAEDGLPGSDLVQEFQEGIKQLKHAVSSESLSNWEIDEIQAHIHMITRPSWHHGAPQNLDNPEHGKLKAEQWRGSIKFDLPVILWKLWGEGLSEDSEQSSCPGNWQTVVPFFSPLL